LILNDTLIIMRADCLKRIMGMENLKANSNNQSNIGVHFEATMLAIHCVMLIHFIQYLSHGSNIYIATLSMLWINFPPSFTSDTTFIYCFRQGECIMCTWSFLIHELRKFTKELKITYSFDHISSLYKISSPNSL
jgi:hypothetical protein